MHKKHEPHFDRGVERRIKEAEPTSRHFRLLSNNMKKKRRKRFAFVMHSPKRTDNTLFFILFSVCACIIMVDRQMQRWVDTPNCTHVHLQWTRAFDWCAKSNLCPLALLHSIHTFKIDNSQLFLRFNWNCKVQEFTLNCIRSMAFGMETIVENCLTNNSWQTYTTHSLHV